MFILLAIIFVSVIYIYYWNAFKYWNQLGVPSLPASFPFGNVFRVVVRLESVNDKVCQVYEYMKSKGHKYAGLYFFSRKVFLPIDPQLIRNILLKDFNYFNDRGIYYDEENDPVSAHLFSLSGKKWRTLRTKLTPAFTAGKTKYMFESILQCSNEMLALLDEIREDQVNASSVEIKDILARFTTDVIGSCAFGIECNSLKNPNAEFRLMGRRAFTQTPSDAFKMIVIRSFPKVARFLRLSVFASNVSAFFKNVVEDTINYREKFNVTRPDFLQLLIQMKNRDSDTSEGNELTMNEIAAQAFIFFLAGFETTSTTISFALLELALNQEIQERARSELRKVLDGHENQLTYDVLGELQYLEMVILESLRKYPPAPVFLRKCTQRYPIPGSDAFIEKGLSILIPAMALHRDPEFHPEPEVFDPERFNEENKYKMKEQAYLPFGDGPRICIGMRFAMVQSKLALAQFLRNYRFTLSPKTLLPLKMETKGIVLTPIGGIWLDFQKLEI